MHQQVLYQVLRPLEILKNGGQKGPQLTVLPPGKYRINRYLFSVEFQDATDIPAGFVGVVKANVQETPTGCLQMYPMTFEAPWPSHWLRRVRLAFGANRFNPADIT